MTIIATVLRIFISVIISLATIVAPGLLADYTAPNAPLDSEDCRLNFAALSDLHVEAMQFNKGEAIYADFIHAAILPDLENAQEKLDALVLAGDITDNGYDAQWEKTYEILSGYDLADEIILAAGNHDLWTRGNGDRTSKGLFMQYSNKISDRLVTQLYYSTEVNGYPFIVLSSETDSTAGYFSNKQISWLKAELKKAAKKDLPIFVICHWPINQTHGLPITWGDDEPELMDGGMGEQSAKIEKALKKYDNVFLFSGHIHNGFSNADDMAQTGYESIESVGSFHSVNLPRTTWFGENGHFMVGTGYNVEVYDDEVVFRARNYITGTWLPKYNYTIELV